MKHICSILLLVSFLFAGTACEDDYRDMVFFTGDKPIYQKGTCDNLISSVNLFLTHPDGIVVGVDGGSGSYSVISGDDAIVTAVLAKAENGYARVLITPKAEGTTVVTARDSEGNQALLRIEVDECLKLTFVKLREGIVITGEVTEEKKNEISAAFTGLFTVKVMGKYELIPDVEDNLWMGGTLRVYTDDKATTPILGRYDSVAVGEQQHRGVRFSYNDEEHFYSFGTFPEVTRVSPVNGSIDFWEDVTELCPVELPQESKIYHIEQLVREDYYRD